jgi:hypothetical protein
MQAERVLGLALQAGQGPITALAGWQSEMPQQRHLAALGQERGQQAELGESIQAGWLEGGGPRSLRGRRSFVHDQAGESEALQAISRKQADRASPHHHHVSSQRTG